VERAGNVFVFRRDSFVDWVVVIRVALILKPADKGRPGGTDWGGNDFVSDVFSFGAHRAQGPFRCLVVFHFSPAAPP
jgi:hypothetical protein